MLNRCTLSQLRALLATAVASSSKTRVDLHTNTFDVVDEGIRISSSAACARRWVRTGRHAGSAQPLLYSREGKELLTVHM